MNPPVVDRYLEELLSDIPLMGASQPAAAAAVGAQRRPRRGARR